MATKATPRPELQALRRQKGLTQSKLAAALGCDIFRVAAWEKGRSTPQRRYQSALAALFGLSVEDLQLRVGWRQAEAVKGEK